MFTMTNFAKRGRLSISWRACILLVGLCCPFPVVSSYATDSITEIQQNKTKKFRGNVLDEAGAPVTGATVQIQGKAGGVITDIDGNFTIEVGESDVLQITFIGLETQLVPVRGKASMKIVMKELRDELEEVTVVAFAKQKKESVIGSIQTVKPAELKTPSSNLTTSLAGRMAGVIAYQRSGEPGKDNANFFIRGVTTFGYKKDPLILLDNVEVSSDDLARVQPDDIASFSVLKDATSTALYGARGANGVILVTTKEGKEGKAQVSVRVENSFSAPTKMIDIADPISYMRLNNEAVLTRDPQGVIPYPECFKKNGYYVVSNGKVFHNITDHADSWSEAPWRVHPDGYGKDWAEYNKWELWQNEESSRYVHPKTLRGPFCESADVADTTYIDGRVAQKTIADLRRLHKKEKPFFLACGFWKPHLPFNAPKKYWDLYRREEIHLAQNPYRPKALPKQVTSSGEILS